MTPQAALTKRREEDKEEDDSFWEYRGDQVRKEGKYKKDSAVEASISKGGSIIQGPIYRG